MVGLPKKEDFILRKKEYSALLSMARDAVKSSHGTSVNVIGDEGCGKDRLLSVVGDELLVEHDVYEVRCSPFFKKDPYRALLELMKQVTGKYSDENVYAEVIGKVPESGADFHKALEHFRQILLSKPAVYLINNGDNIDRESADFFEKEISPRVGDSACFFAFSGNKRMFSQGENIVLGNLTQKQAIEFAKHVVAKRHPEAELSDTITQELFRISEGNPLFISELVKSMHVKHGRFDLPKDVPSNLKTILLKNARHLPNELQKVLEMYSLMHSVAVMAPILDSKYYVPHMEALRDKGFLRPDFEFASDLLQSSVAASMDPGEKQEICTSLAKAAEQRGMADHLAIFEYYRNGILDTENRKRALEHAEAHVQKTGYLYLIRDEFYKDVLALAHDPLPEQRRIVGMMLYRLAYSISHAEVSIENMQRTFKIAERSRSLLKREDVECRALAQMANALTSMGHLEMQIENKENAMHHLTEGKGLYELARKKAQEANQALYYLLISTKYADALSIQCNEPYAARKMLKQIEKELPDLISRMEENFGSRAIIALFYKSSAEALQRTGKQDLPLALKNIEIGLKKSEEIGYDEGILMCKATKAEILFKMGEFEMAKELAQMALQYIEENGVNAAEVEDDMRNLISQIDSTPPYSSFIQ
jgi:hypothetical protein